MDIKTLKLYPLAALYAWREPLFVTPQGVSEEASERRIIRAKVVAELPRQRDRESDHVLGGTSYDDLI